jgi:hypothetical protein
MTANYDTSTPGKPYVRANRITIDFPAPGSGNPTVTIEQRVATKLTTGDSAEIGTMATISHEIDLANIGGVVFDLVDLDTDAPYGQQATLPQLIVFLASYVRSLQRGHNG